MPTSIVFLETEHKDYAQRRKILASAFYKNNVSKMIDLIKSVTVNIVRDLHEKKTSEVDIVELTKHLQQRVIINVSVGPNFSDNLMDFENDDGQVIKRPIYQVIFDVIATSMMRSDTVLYLIFPELLPFAIMPTDRRNARNIERLRQEIRKVIRAFKEKPAE